MTTQRDDVLDRVAGLLEPTPEALPDFHRRLQRRHRSRRIGAYAMVAAMVAIAVVAIAVVGNGPTRPVPADDPTPTEDLGIFAPVAGRIVYNDREYGFGLNGGLWAVDPDSPEDLVESDQVRLSPDNAWPLGWSRDGTELLFMRTRPYPNAPGRGTLLFILHADGSETRVTKELMDISSATISPDGSRIVFARWNRAGLYAVDADGGPAELLLEGGPGALYQPTFSPDGTQIAYINGGGDHTHNVWVMNADGSDAHEIVSNEWTAPIGHVRGLAWSPAGDRIALSLVDGPSPAIYMFAPDGSDFTQVIPGGTEPYWSPDGSQIAYRTAGRIGFAIADTDGSNVRQYDFGTSGPWHPVG
jgi:dipeptidyl aminopeptidase/acylaminoacyl peptidase